MAQNKLKGVIGVESPSPRSFWCGMTHMNETSHIWMSHDTHIWFDLSHDSFGEFLWHDTCEWDISHTGGWSERVAVRVLLPLRDPGCVAVCVAVCCSVLQCCSVLLCIAVCCSVLQCVAVCCSALQCIAVCCVCHSVLQCVAVCCSALQCIAVRCSAISPSFARLLVVFFFNIYDLTMIWHDALATRLQSEILIRSYIQLINSYIQTFLYWSRKPCNSETFVCTKIE